jgi:hypothetical protein
VADTEVKEKLAEAGITLERVETLHPVVEKLNGLGISDENLENFVKEHQVFEDNGITKEEFQKVAVALAKAGEINGDNLAAKLMEFGNLDEVITSMKAEKTSLQSIVEKLGKDKIELTEDVDGLVKSKAHLEKEVGHLEGAKKALEDTNETLQVRRDHLEKHLEQLENDIAKLEGDKVFLEEQADQKNREINEINEKLKEAGDIDQKLKELREELLELDNKKAAVGSKFGLFEAFLGLVGKRSVPEIEEFHKFMPTLVKKTKTGHYDSGLLVNTVLGQLSGGTLDRISCDNCGVEFVMLKRAQKAVQMTWLSNKMTCPDCGGSLKTEVIIPLGATQKNIIMTGKPTLEISRITPPKEENKTDDSEVSK